MYNPKNPMHRLRRFAHYARCGTEGVQTMSQQRQLGLDIEQALAALDSVWEKAAGRLLTEDEKGTSNMAPPETGYPEIAS